MEDSILIEQLATFGLTQIEARVYLHLVNKQSKSILEIARELDVPRTSIYDSAVRLAEKGLVQKIVTFKSQKLQAYPLSILHAYIDKEKARIETMQEKLVSLEASLAQVTASPLNTEVRYFSGAKGFQQMIWNTLRAEQELVGYSQFGRVEVTGQKFMRRHSEEMIRRGIRDRVITNPVPDMLKYLKIDPLNSYRGQFQSTRILTTDQLDVSGDTAIYNNVFAVTYWQQGEIVGVEIENAELVKTQKSIFELLWSQTEPLEKYLPVNVHTQNSLG